MQAFALFQEDKQATGTDDYGGKGKAEKESEGEVTGHETGYRTSGSTCGPVDITALKTHEFEGPLQSLENRVLQRRDIRLCHSERGFELLHAEEQRKGLGCGNQEDTGADEKHNLLLDILLAVLHVMID